MDDDALRRYRRLGEVEARIAAVCGRINAAHGELIDLVAEALELGAAEGPGLRSPGHWTAWRTGSTAAHGVALARIAQRRAELPETCGALRRGELSVDQAATIAAGAPAWADAELADLATSMTPSQLAKTCRSYPLPDGDSPARPRRYGVTLSPTNDGDVRIAGLLPGLTGSLVADAHRTHLDALMAEWQANRSCCGEGDDDTSLPTGIDALVRMADRSLAADAADRPQHERHRVLLHVDVDRRHAQVHLGPALTDELRRLATCDATYQTVFHRDGRPIGVGRIRGIPRRLRIAVEHRDGGCRVPGCSARWTHLHHVEHHEDGGETETWNLIALCPHHHRLHHRGLLGIHGTDADDPDGIAFTDRHGRTITGVGPPTPPSGADPAHPSVGVYHHPSGERLNPHWLTPQAVSG